MSSFLPYFQWIKRFTSLHLVKKVSYHVAGCYLYMALTGVADASVAHILPHTIQKTIHHKPVADASVEHISPYTIQKAAYHKPRAFYLVLHYTAGNLKGSLQTLTNPKYSVSAHYLVPKGPKKGKRSVYELVNESDRAWCQGISAWQGNSDLNSTGISIEIVNQTRANKKGIVCFKPYPAYQIDTVAMLSQEIINRYNIDPTHVVGHSDVCPYRKIDPGPLFPWEMLHKVYGIGAWPNEVDVRYYKTFLPKHPSLYEVLYRLVVYGYPIKREDTDQIKDAEAKQKAQWKQVKDVIIAFQMHFRPRLYDGRIDQETAAILYALVKKYRPKVTLKPDTCAMLKDLATQLQPFYQALCQKIKEGNGG